MESKSGTIPFVKCGDDWDIMIRLMQVFAHLDINLKLEISKTYDPKNHCYNNFKWKSPPTLEKSK